MKALAFASLFVSAVSLSAPVWSMDPIELEGEANIARYVHLMHYVKTESGGPVTFRWVGTTPSFLTLGPEGYLLVSPREKDVGKHEFRLAAVEGEASAVATLVVSVTEGPQFVPDVRCPDGSLAVFVGKTSSGSTLWECRSPPPPGVASPRSTP